MKSFVWVTLCLVLLVGCAHLEGPGGEIYPFRAEFTARGTVQSSELSLQGAILLTSAETGIIQTYGPGGLATGTIDIAPGRLVIKDMWGRSTDTVELPLHGIIGLMAGDLPHSAYLYKMKAEGGMKVVYPWGSLFIDEEVLPREVHVSGEKPLDVVMTPSGRSIDLVVNYGPDTLWISLLVIQGGGWISS